MYAFLRGTVASLSATTAVLDVNGIGFHLFIPTSLLGSLTPGEEVTLHTSFQVRETSHQLFGFPSPSERDFFEKLCTISGIGPKLAMSLIGHLPAEQLQQAIYDGDAAAISRVPGIGKKTAERVIIDLRDKMAPTAKPLGSPLLRDAVAALINLGYTQAKAHDAVQKTMKESPTSDLSSLITTSLKHL